jgi:predicted alpha-1,6-mannanase (GH76 family)
MPLARAGHVRAVVLASLAACTFPHGTEAGSGSATPDAPVAPPDPTTSLWHDRADAALQAMLVRGWMPDSGYLAAQLPATTTLTGYWTFAQALDAVEDGVERTHGIRFAGWIEGLYLAQDAIGWSRDFYDDENWMTLALLRAYDLTGDARYLARAKALYADIEAAWDTTCCGAHPGGIWWDRPHTQKATASNAGPVIAGVRLAARTGDARYLAFAQQAYDYWLTTMVDPGTHAVVDHVTSAGAMVHYRFTYNEGLVVGAATELYRATRDPGYLATAHAVAGHVLAAEAEPTREGSVLFDGTNAGCMGDCQQFKGIAYRYLAELQETDPRDDYAAVLAASAHAAWDLARGGTGLFAPDWAGPIVTSTSLDAQSSAAMAIALYARSLGDDPIVPLSIYEAEDGVVHAIGLETSHGDFTGWGYLAGWIGDGESVDLHVQVAAAGTYQVTMRYAAAAGDASRVVQVNGNDVAANLALPSTGSWDRWSNAAITASLPAGDSTITIGYDSSKGSTSYVNLDSITVAP